VSAGLSPLLDPGRGPRRNYRRRRHGRFAALLLVGALAVALAGALTGAFSAGASSRSGKLRSAAARAPGPLAGTTGAIDTAQPLPRSPAGLLLATPAFALTGLGDTATDVVHPGFRNPPREGLLFNLDTGQVLWQVHPYARAPIASLTKMMTALLAVRSLGPQAPVMVTRQAEAMPGSRVGLLPLGKTVPAEALLYGLLLPSGNDAAVALAQGVAGTQARFVAEMNQEAAALGLGCTRYSNPSGYYDQGNFSCAADLAVLAHEDLEQPRIARIVGTSTAVLPFPIKGGKLYLENNNPLLMYGYPGADGVKTGWTEAAGTCLVASAQRHGVRLGVVLLHSPAPGTQAQSLFNDAFGGVYHQRTPHEAPIPGGA
jgi:D-alanyl-D-alanine carboxypeptidase (penicillin-binding protein 5/6)